MPDRSSKATATATPNTTIPPRPKAAPPQPAAPSEPAVGPPQSAPAAVPSQQPASVDYKFAHVPVPDTPIQPEPDERLTNDKRVTYHKDHIHYKVTVKCKWCCSSYTADWTYGSAPYEELKAKEWTQGKDKSGNWTWQQARCPIHGKCVRPF